MAIHADITYICIDVLMLADVQSSRSFAVCTVRVYCVFQILVLVGYNVPNLSIYIPIYSVFIIICYSFMVHSFHKAVTSRLLRSALYSTQLFNGYFSHDRDGFVDGPRICSWTNENVTHINRYWLLSLGKSKTVNLKG